jgi:CheY-like chemotaxis protein/HPt (histidine-containing phosphotransfer) domain-containing protein
MMLTSGGRPGDAARGKELGFAAYLTKPVKQADLWRALVRALDAGPAAAPPAPAKRTTAPPRPLRILLAEDNPMNQKLAVRLLEKQGHRVTVANNGREALARLFGPGPADGGSAPAPRFDVVLMDVQMPEMDGLTAAATIRERERGTGRHVPVVAMTAHAMKGDQERCLAAGMDAYVSKPIKPDALFAILAEVTPPVPADGPREPSAGLKQCVCWADALKHVRGDEGLLREVATIFLAEWPGWLSALRNGLERGDAEQLGRTAHTVKGSLGAFAAAAAHAAAEHLEAAATARRWDDAAAALAGLEHEMQVLLPPLTAFAEGGPP